MTSAEPDGYHYCAHCRHPIELDWAPITWVHVETGQEECRR